MADTSLYAGLTSQSIDVFLADSTSSTGNGLSGLLFNSSGLKAYYRKGATGTVTAITLATQTVGGAFSSGGFVEVDSTNMKGVYRFDIPNGVIDTEGFASIYFYGATNLVPTAIRIDCRPLPGDIKKLLGTAWLTPSTAGTPDVNTKLVGGQTASASGTVTFPNATLASTTNITAGTITTTTNLTNLPSITTDWITAAGVSAAAVTKIQSGLSTYAGGDTSGTTTLLGRVTSTRAGNLDYLDAAISSRSTYAGGAVASVTGAVGSVTGNVGGSVASVTAEVSANVTKINSVSTSSVSSIASHIGTTGASTAQTGDSYPIVSHVTYGLSAINTAISAIATKLGGITLLKNWLGALMGKTADSGTLAEITATTAGAGYNNTTDSLEALKDSQVDTDGLAGDVADAVVESLGDAAINVTVVSAFNQNGTRLRIRRGDDYASSNGRSLSFNISGLTAAVGTVAHLRLNGLESDAAVSSTITLATQTVTFGDVLAATTTQLTASKQPQPYTITFTIDGLTATMIEGWMYVSDPV